MKKHYLKTWTEYYNDIVSGVKKFELRYNDRNFKVGDVLVLQNYNKRTEEYEGEMIEKEIKYILHGGGFGLNVGYVILGL